ncbi:SixA phosphatase family protein [Arcticibacterium luteifluviistationis]|uniref:Phosphohistidine phosphatase n=1 Tax=Arcticibacterium luteifluviistationis TaxID=1784714 RepID=A0A2Z4G961_9BACT|nr:histidine phosphatase family protein [Arcticibacterium luteifluviistationis]AWV97777.1 phosphohistidine phosphatase [Arcticibacterium luteifluviistationis]
MLNKTLYIIRHAQAEDSGNSAMLKDFNRNLTGKGISQSARLGSFLVKDSVKIDCFVSSPANRAFQTAKVLLEQYKLDEEQIRLDESLYGGGPRAYLACLNGISDDFNSLAIFGHNPDITFFAEYLTRDDIGGNMKKATVIEIKFENQAWNEISGKTGDLVRRVDVKSIEI